MMPHEFKSCDSLRIFSRGVVAKSRYMLDAAAKEFLENVAATSRSRILELAENSEVFRAQQGYNSVPFYQQGSEDEEPEHVADELVPFPEERMRPLAARATEGRANPKGIPVLYCSSNQETAVAEVRPWIGAFVSVALFKTKRQLRIVNCADNSAHDLTPWKHVCYLIHDPGPAKKEEVVWHYIDEAFSRPVSQSDDRADYAPTQILAELFRDSGFDGIAYRSAVGEGCNLALFDPDVVEFYASRLFKITKVDVSIELCEPPVF
jgi:RES domain